MKTLFIEAKYAKPVRLSSSVMGKLPSKIGLVSSIQFLGHLPLIKRSLLKKEDKEIHYNKNKIKKIIIGGQILGCNAKSAEKIQNKVDAFLYIGDGQFHPIAVSLATEKPVFQYNPITDQFKKIETETIERYKKRKKGALLKFLDAETVGILVSTKKGQCYNIKKLTNLEKKYPKKRFYTFITETIDYNQLENFPFIEAWVNTACPRIEEDIRIVNIGSLLE